jgi:hypothetical protein
MLGDLGSAIRLCSEWQFDRLSDNHSTEHLLFTRTLIAIFCCGWVAIATFKHSPIYTAQLTKLDKLTIFLYSLAFVQRFPL